MTAYPKKSALLIIDIINHFHFEHGEILAKKTFNMITPLKAIKKYFQDNRLPIIYVNDHYNLWQANLEKIISHCQNDLNRSILKELCPCDDDYFLIKPKHSAFYGTALNTLLHQLKINTLVMTGLAGNICVLFSANDAYMREYKLIIPANCIASVSEDDQNYALTMMKNVLKADITSFI
ncbi:isochorismatase family cysteine hydrolase [Bacillus sp. CGMCC 1.16607]|uniref:isochorismatase family cysteine hydrolase n=1 Tax=Bacillus sp. CGMCC 1.16607 TaxID=3351842 RepID=UPI00362911AC